MESRNLALIFAPTLLPMSETAYIKAEKNGGIQRLSVTNTFYADVIEILINNADKIGYIDEKMEMALNR